MKYLQNIGYYSFAYLYLSASNLLAQTAPATGMRTINDLKARAGTVVGIIMILAFIAGVCFLIAAAVKNDNDPGAAKKALITGAILAGGPLLITIIFYAFGQGSAVVDARYE